MKSKSFFVQTFGCQMNERDSETLAGMLAEKGYIENSERNNSDIIIINTCSVRENADKRFFGTLGQLKRVKTDRPETVVAVCGCMMQQQHIIDTLKAKYPWVDLIFGTHNIHEFPVLLENVINEKEKIVDVWNEAEDIVENLPSLRKHPSKAYVNIMYGCDNFCTYCIVPFTRGRERSRAPEAIMKEVKYLAEDGVVEIMLLGQNVNSYKGRSYTGKGKSEKEHVMDFAGLINILDKIEGIERIRFMTSHPKDVSPELIKAFSSCESLCPHIHLPVQSGSTRILKKMNRRYTKEKYLDLIEKLRNEVPDIAITTDIIVGFPGETEEDFKETIDLVNRVRFDSAFTFLYSIRKGTPSEKYCDQIPEAVKHERFNRLVDAVNTISAVKNEALIGDTVKVLAEGKSKTNQNLFAGRTEGNKLINFASKEFVTGRIVNVSVTGSSTFSLKGIMTGH